MIFAVDPPDRRIGQGRNRPPQISRSVYGPPDEIATLLEAIPEVLVRGEQDASDGKKIVFVDSSATATLKNHGVKLVNKYEIAKMIAGKPLDEV